MNSQNGNHNQNSQQKIDADFIKKDFIKNIVNNPDIIKKNKSLNDKIHIINIVDLFGSLFQRIFPVLRSYIILGLVIYGAIATIMAGTLNKIIEFVTHKQGDWSLLLIGCATYVSIVFINKKWK